MIRNNNQRQYQNMYQRILKKQNKGIVELEQYLHKVIDQFIMQPILEYTKNQCLQEINNLVKFFINKTKTLNHQEIHCSLLIETLQSIAYLLEEHKLIQHHFHDIAITILAYFSDANQKIRITAIGSIYNLLNMHSHRGLELFMQTFEALSINVSDSSGQVRQAAAFLNQTLKTIINSNDTIVDHKIFNMKNFVETLAEKFQTDQIILKQFLLDWIMAIQQIPQFQLSFYLPHFFKEAVQLLCPWNAKNLRTKSQECLKKFLHVFRQNLALGKSISTKIDSDNARMLIEMTLLMIKQNISNESTLQSLQWLQIFTRYFTSQLKAKKQSHLELFYSFFLKQILQVIIHSLSNDSEKIRKIAQIINDSLLQVFPAMRKEEKKINETSFLLQKLLHQNKIPARVGQTIIKWIKLLLQEHSEQILVEINSLINCVVEKLCDRHATKQLFLLLEGSLFVQEYLDLLIQTLLNYLCQNEGISPEPILIQLLSFQKSENIFLVICKRVRSFQNYNFQYRLLEHLMIILVTERNLQFLRTKLQNDYSSELLFQLLQCFCKNEASVIILGFLSKQYHLITKFIVFLGEQQRLTRQKLKSLLKMSNLIEHSNLNHLRTDLKRSPLAMKSYLAFLMILPYGKYQSVLLQRLEPQKRTLKVQVSQEEQRLCAALLHEYKNIWKEQWQQQNGE